MGVELVEGRDLVVYDNIVYMRTTASLPRVTIRSNCRRELLFVPSNSQWRVADLFCIVFDHKYKRI